MIPVLKRKWWDGGWRSWTMSFLQQLSIAALLSSIFPGRALAQQVQAPTHLQVDSLVTPLGIDSRAPEFSWQLRDARFGARQSAYRITVASIAALLDSGKPDVWDSGKIESDRSVAVRYAGLPLQPARRYYWRVSVWDKDGAAY